MAQVTLKLTLNPRTGERTLLVDYTSDPDLLGYEHEADHRALVERILGKPLSAIADHLVIRDQPQSSILVEEDCEQQGHTEELAVGSLTKASMTPSKGGE